MLIRLRQFAFLFLICLSRRVIAETNSPVATELPDVVVSGSSEPKDAELGNASSASQGTVSAEQIEARPTARTADIMESVPGLIVTQHSGGGKANQYYLRGFNLDHGTDLAGYVDGVPINLPTHAHGQGYLDLNWLIPELVKEISYEKGIYYADQGDFANAGAVSIDYMKEIPKSLAVAQVGGFGYERALFADSPKLTEGKLLYALELQHDDGPWQTANNYRRANGMIRYSHGDDQKGYSLSTQLYYGRWLATDQIPQRAIDSGLLDRFSTIDPSSGGDTDRVSVYGEWHHRDDDSATNLVGYLAQYHLNLYSDFTYFLDQINGDQINQRDSRVYTGVRSDHSVYGKLLGHEMENAFGLQLRQDWVNATLNNTENREIIAHTRTDHVSELNIAPWYQNKVQWSSWFRTTLGLRADAYYFDVASDLTPDSGNEWTGTANPKLSLVFGPWSRTEWYVEGGTGFRTNDARGIFGSASPVQGEPSRQLPAIVHTHGAETGVRSEPVDGWKTTLSFWSLWSQSDTFFDGDSGSVVDADRPGVRYGVEWSNLYTPRAWISFDADLAYSYAYFTDGDPTGVGRYIPESVTDVISTGVSVHDIPGFERFFGSMRMREFGPRPLIEDDSEKSAPSTVFNFEAGYHLNPTWTASLEILNLFNTDYNDNEYYYSSRLKGEPAGNGDGGGIDDHMIHAGDPRTLRVSVAARF